MSRPGSRPWLSLAAVLVLTGMVAAPLCAKPVIAAADLAYHERPGNAVPMSLPFRDADDRIRSLADIAQGRPLILVPAYYDCTSLCGLVRSSLYGALARSGDTGNYALAIVSIDPQEHSSNARMARAQDQHAIAALRGLQPQYLTGSAGNIRAVTDAVGFRSQRDPLSGQFLHPAGVVFVTARGTVSNYLLGVGYTPAQVRSALQRARAGVLAQVGAPLLLLCFHFDATTGRYSLEIMKVLRLAGILTVLTLLGVMLLMWRRERA